MQEVGRLCLDRHTSSIELLSRNMGNFVLALYFIHRHQMIEEVVSTHQQSHDASPLPIMNFFICVHYFYDSFQGSLYKCFTDLVDSIGASPQTRSCVLVKLLYAMILCLEKDWRVLNVTLELFPEVQLKKLATSPDLYMFCLGLYNYINALLKTHASWHKDNKDEKFTQDREKLYETAKKYICGKLQAPAYEKVVSYFSVQIQLDLAEAIWSETHHMPTIKRAAKTCARTQKFLEKVPMLKNL